MKRVLAFAAALCMLTAVGCGEISENRSKKEKDKTETSAAEQKEEKTSNEDNEQDGSSQQDTGDSESGENGEGSEGSPDVSGMVNAENCLINAGSADDDDSPYDEEVLYRMMELAVEQYNTIADQDKQAYFDTLNLKGILADEGSKRIYRATTSKEKISGVEAMVYYNAVMALDGLDDSKLEEIEASYNAGSITEDEAADGFYDEINSMCKDLTAEELPLLFDEYSPYNYLFRDESSEMPADYKDNSKAYKIVPGEGTIFGIEVDQYVSSSYGIFAELDMIACCGDWEYIFDECSVWIKDDQASIYISNPDIRENEVKGMTMDEIKEMTASNENLAVNNTRAKLAYHEICEYLSEQEMEGRKLETVLEDDDFLLTAGDGIDFTDPEIGHKVMGPGDKVILDLYDSGDIAIGQVYLGLMEKNGEQTFFVQFKDKSGNIGQYPDPITKERSAKVSWKTFLSTDEAAER